MDEAQRRELALLLKKDSDAALAAKLAVDKRAEEHQRVLAEFRKLKIEVITPAAEAFGAELAAAGHKVTAKDVSEQIREQSRVSEGIVIRIIHKSIIGTEKEHSSMNMNAPEVSFTLQNNLVSVGLTKVRRTGGGTSGTEGVLPFREVTAEKVSTYLLDLFREYLDT